MTLSDVSIERPVLTWMLTLALIVLGLLGYYAMRIAASSGGSRRSSNKEGGGAVAAILLLGLALMIIGYVGTFFGSLIKAAVSRQREFLADASAVQFTRNPGGISGALARIASANGSKLETPRAAEASHMFFASGLWTLFATHPPLTERIARIDASKAALLAESGASGLATVAGCPAVRDALPADGGTSLLDGVGGATKV